MIKSFRHRGLEELYESRQSRHVKPVHQKKLLQILGFLDRSSKPAGMRLPGFDLHKLKGNQKGRYAVSVSTNWRVTFQFEGGNAVDVDYEDYY